MKMLEPNVALGRLCECSFFVVGAAVGASANTFKSTEISAQELMFKLKNSQSPLVGESADPKKDTKPKEVPSYGDLEQTPFNMFFTTVTGYISTALLTRKYVVASGPMPPEAQSRPMP